MTATQQLPTGVTVTQLETVRARVRIDFADADKSHDYDHLSRVEGLAAHIALAMGADEMVCRIAALVHDYHRLDGNHGLDTTGKEGTQAAASVAHDAGIPASLVASISECVAFTDRYTMAGDELKPPTLEAAVVRDADNLDAMGAIGIARAFTFGATIQEPMWAPQFKVRDHYDRGRAPSVIHHFHEKLLNLKDELLTDSGIAIGAQRHKVMTEYVAAFQAEWQVHD